MSERSESVEGGCLCGAVRYRAHGPGTNATLCHCSSCRRATGAPAVAWVTFPSAGLTFTTGTPRVHRSSAHVERAFCGSCGTQLTYRRDDLPDEVDVTTSSLDRPLAFPPADHTWTSEQLAWLTLDDALPRYARARDD